MIISNYTNRAFLEIGRFQFSTLSTYNQDDITVKFQIKIHTRESTKKIFSLQILWQGLFHFPIRKQLDDCGRLIIYFKTLRSSRTHT